MKASLSCINKNLPKHLNKLKMLYLGQFPWRTWDLLKGYAATLGSFGVWVMTQCARTAAVSLKLRQERNGRANSSPLIIFYFLCLFYISMYLRMELTRGVGSIWMFVCAILKSLLPNLKPTEYHTKASTYPFCISQSFDCYICTETP